MSVSPADEGRIVADTQPTYLPGRIRTRRMSGERGLIVPRHPSRGVRSEFGGMALQGDQILERSDVIEFGGVDQAHEHVTDVGAGEGSIEQGIFPMQDRLLQRALRGVV